MNGLQGFMPDFDRFDKIAKITVEITRKGQEAETHDIFIGVEGEYSIAKLESYALKKLVSEEGIKRITQIKFLELDQFKSIMAKNCSQIAIIRVDIIRKGEETETCALINALYNELSFAELEKSALAQLKSVSGIKKVTRIKLLTPEQFQEFAERCKKEHPRSWKDALDLL